VRFCTIGDFRGVRVLRVKGKLILVMSRYNSLLDVGTWRVEDPALRGYAQNTGIEDIGYRLLCTLYFRF